MIQSMQWSLAEIVTALRSLAPEVGAYLRQDLLNSRVDGISTDSRTLQPGELFVALSGEHFDGHQFIAEVLQKEALAVLVAEAQQEQWEGLDRVLVVSDTLLALGKLAQTWRQRFTLPTAAITGSNGKTTVKEMLGQMSKAYWGEEAVWATRGNLNNQIGLPQTLFGLREQHRALLLEIGMSHPGEIAYLTQIAQPTVALVNNAHAAHLEGLGSVDAIALEKGDLYRYLPQQGVGVVNADSPYAGLWRTLLQSPEFSGSEPVLPEKRILSFSFDGKVANKAADIVSTHCVLEQSLSKMQVKTPLGSLEIQLRVPGMHNARNALAAIAVGVALGIDLPSMKLGLENFVGVSGRLQAKHLHARVLLLDDTYNANPASVKAAIEVLAQQPGQRILVLGDMGELGPTAEALHATTGEYARQQGIEGLYALGSLTAATVEAYGTGSHGRGQHFKQLTDLLTVLQRDLDLWLANSQPGEMPKTTARTMTILVKGSRFMRMERIVSALTTWAEERAATQGKEGACYSG